MRMKCTLCQGRKLFDECPACGSSGQGAAIVVAPKDLGPKKPAGAAKQLPPEVLVPARMPERSLVFA